MSDSIRINEGSSVFISGNIENNKEKLTTTSSTLIPTDNDFESLISVWEETRDNGKRIIATIFSSSLSSHTTLLEFEVSSTEEYTNQTSPIVTIIDNNYLVSWKENGIVYAKLFDSNHSVIKDKFPLDMPSSRNLSVTTLDNEKTVIFSNYSVYDGINYTSTSQLNGKILDSSGNSISALITIDSTENIDFSDMVVQSLGNNRFIVLWTSTDIYSYRSNITAQIFDDLGNPMGSQFTVNNNRRNDNTLYDRQSPAITVLDNGNLVITWDSYEGDDGRDIFGKIFDSNGSRVKGEFRVNNQTTNTQNDSSIISLNYGYFLVAWESSSERTPNEIHYQLFNQNGDKVNSEFRLTHNGVPEQELTLTALANGDAVITWLEDRLNTGTKVIKSKLLQVDYPPVIAFRENSITVNEDNLTVEVELFLNEVPTQEVTATIVPSGITATENRDFNEDPIEVTFAAGETSKIIEIGINNDPDYEINETFSLELTEVQGAITWSNALTNITILENDFTNAEPGTLAFSQPKFIITESGQAVSEITVTREGGSDKTVTATISLIPLTTDENDLDINSITITFNHGETTPKTIQLPIKDDKEFELTETLQLQITEVTNDAVIGSQATAIVEILDNDVLPQEDAKIEALLDEKINLPLESANQKFEELKEAVNQSQPSLWLAPEKIFQANQEFLSELSELSSLILKKNNLESKHENLNIRESYLEERYKNQVRELKEEISDILNQILSAQDDRLQLVFNPENGKYYFVTSESGNIGLIKAIGDALGGPILIIDDAEEQQFIEDNFSGDFWLGIHDQAREGDWRTPLGKHLTYTNWAEGQPDNWGAGEHYGMIYDSGEWNDTRSDNNLRGIIELETDAVGAELNGYIIQIQQRLNILGTHFQDYQDEMELLLAERRQIDSELDTLNNERLPDQVEAIEIAKSTLDSLGTEQQDNINQYQDNLDTFHQYFKDNPFLKAKDRSFFAPTINYINQQIERLENEYTRLKNNLASLESTLHELIDELDDNLSQEEYQTRIDRITQHRQEIDKLQTQIIEQGNIIDAQIIHRNDLQNYLDLYGSYSNYLTSFIEQLSQKITDLETSEINYRLGAEFEFQEILDEQRQYLVELIAYRDQVQLEEANLNAVKQTANQISNEIDQAIDTAITESSATGYENLIITIQNQLLNFVEPWDIHLNESHDITVEANEQIQDYIAHSSQLNQLIIDTVTEPFTEYSINVSEWDEALSIYNVTRQRYEGLDETVNDLRNTIELFRVELDQSEAVTNEINRVEHLTSLERHYTLLNGLFKEMDNLEDNQQQLAESYQLLASVNSQIDSRMNGLPGGLIFITNEDTGKVYGISNYRITLNDLLRPNSGLVIPGTDIPIDSLFRPDVKKNLVTINNEDEQDWLANNFGNDRFWIGLHDASGRNDIDDWQWYSGESFTYSAWDRDQPSWTLENNVLFGFEGNGTTWHDVSAVEKFGVAFTIKELYEEKAVYEYDFSDLYRSKKFLEGKIETLTSQSWNEIDVFEIEKSRVLGELFDSFNLTEDELLTIANAEGAIYNPENGNYYFTTPKTTWYQSQAYAEAKGGNLVVINDAQEQAFIASNFNEENYWNDTQQEAPLLKGIVELDFSRFQTIYNPENGHFYLKTPHMTWQNAQAYAEAKGGNLLVIDNAQEQDFIASNFNDTDYWLGITDQESTTNDNPADDWVTIDGDPIQFTNWAVGEPNDGDAGEDFGMIYSNGTWNDAEDYHLFKGIIEWDQSFAQTFTIFADVRDSQNVKYYFETPVALTWHEAKAFAKSYGGKLAVIDDSRENSFIGGHFNRMSGRIP